MLKDNISNSMTKLGLLLSNNPTGESTEVNYTGVKLEGDDRKAVSEITPSFTQSLLPV